MDLQVLYSGTAPQSFYTNDHNPRAVPSFDWGAAARGFYGHVMKKETWLDVVGYEGLYKVSDAGRVMSYGVVAHNQYGAYTKPRKIIGYTGRYGYRIVNLSKGGASRELRVNRIVCEAFHGPPPSKRHQAAHADGVRHNDCANNLRWATPSENQMDRVKHGTSNQGERQHNAKLTETTVHIARAMNRSGHYSKKQIAKMFGVKPAAMGSCLFGDTWKHLPGSVPRKTLLK